MLEAVVSQSRCIFIRFSTDNNGGIFRATNHTVPSSDDLPYTRSIGPPFILLLPYATGTPVCGLLWDSMDRRNKGDSFSLELIDPVSEMRRVLSARCISGRQLDIDWDTTAELRHIDHSGHPCNMSHPPCLGKAMRIQTTPPPETPVMIPQNFWGKIRQAIAPGRKRLAPDSEPESPDDVELPELALFRSSLQLAPDLRTYRVIVETHHQRSGSGQDTIFCLTLSFGRCGRGHNMLSLRCPTGDSDGLTVDIR